MVVSPGKMKAEDELSGMGMIAADSNSKEIRSPLMKVWRRMNGKVLVLCFVALGLFLSMYYYYLASLYLVDEVLDSSGPKELTIEEKFTIRVMAPKSKSAMGEFVAKYSICPAVEEIQIIWGHADKDPPDASSYVYDKTHSTVIYEIPTSPGRSTPPTQTQRASQDWHPTSYAASAMVKTNAVLLLDADVLVSCADLAFAHSVWRSGQNALVGFFPRLHQSVNQKGTEFKYYGWSHVWWNQVYVLMLIELCHGYHFMPVCRGYHTESSYRMVHWRAPIFFYLILQYH